MSAGSPVRLRLAELIATLSLATDLGLGQPMSHALRTCLLAVRLGRMLDVNERLLADAYYTTLLRFVGCTADSHDLFEFAAGEDVRFRHLMVEVANGSIEEISNRLVRFLTEAGVAGNVQARVRESLESPEGLGAQISRVHCEVATMLAGRLGLGRSVCDALGHSFERWDGRGFPGRLRREEIPLAVRLAVLARDIEVLTRTCSVDEMRSIVRHRRDRAYDPVLADAFLANEAVVLEAGQGHDPWQQVLRAEPGGPVWISNAQLDTALTAFADFADAKTPFTLGHSRGVADLAGTAARHLGLAATDATMVRRAALVHDIGRSGIPNAIWECQGPLTIDQWERVRLHAYYTERIVVRCDGLAPIAAIAGAHHERLNGTGYHRGARGADLDLATRLVAAADACQAMLQERPHRPARTADDAVRELRAEASAGRLDARAVEAVAAAAGAAPRRPAGATPRGLTDREIEVLRLMVKGQSNREMAERLGITPKTVGHHVQHIYDKIGVSTRAAAAVFAMEQHLI